MLTGGKSQLLGKNFFSRHCFPELEIQAPDPLSETLGARCVTVFFKTEEGDNAADSVHHAGWQT